MIHVILFCIKLPFKSVDVNSLLSGGTEFNVILISLFALGGKLLAYVQGVFVQAVPITFKKASDSRGEKENCSIISRWV